MRMGRWHGLKRGRSGFARSVTVGRLCMDVCHWLLQCSVWNSLRQPLLEAMDNVGEDDGDRTALILYMHVGTPCNYLLLLQGLTPEHLCHSKALVHPEDHSLFLSPVLDHFDGLQRFLSESVCNILLSDVSCLQASLSMHQLQRTGNQQSCYAGIISLLGFSCRQHSYLTSYSTHRRGPFPSNHQGPCSVRMGKMGRPVSQPTHR